MTKTGRLEEEFNSFKEEVLARLDALEGKTPKATKVEEPAKVETPAKEEPKVEPAKVEPAKVEEPAKPAKSKKNNKTSISMEAKDGEIVANEVKED